MKAKTSSRQRPTLRREKKALSRGYRIVAGVDEAGVGPLAGPIVAAAVVLSGHRFRNRVNDSKLLAPRAREKAYAEILENSACSVAVIGRDVIDAVNIYNATRLAMEKAVIGLPVSPDYVLVDGRMRLSLPCRAEAIVKGDRKCLSIACASIVAKVWRDKIMERLHDIYPQYGFIRHKGYGTAAHRKKLRIYGPSPLHRLSFEPVRAAKVR